MKKIAFLAGFAFISMNLNAQVGINTTTPDASAALDIQASDKGILIPRINLTSLTQRLDPNVPNAETLIIFNDNGTTYEKGLYFWLDGKWNKEGSDKSNFVYMPSIPLPVGPGDPLLTQPNYETETGSNGIIYKVNVYELFKKQFVTPISSSNNNETLSNFIKQPSEYTFFVTEADQDLFQSISIDSNGILRYRIDETAIIRSSSFMNIVVKY